MSSAPRRPATDPDAGPGKRPGKHPGQHPGQHPGGQHPDNGVLRVLEELGARPESRLGFGGEAWVFAADAERVLRIHHTHVSRTAVDARTALLRELGAGAGRASFAIPSVLETRVVLGRVVTMERRLPGRPLTEALRDATGAPRQALIRAYLDASHALGDLPLARTRYGDLTRGDALAAESFGSYLERRAEDALRRAGTDFAHLSAAALATACPEPDRPAFVHLDAFPGNMLEEDGVITAVIDFGGVSLAGDRRFDPIASAAYLDPRITPTGLPCDVETAMSWLEEHALLGLYPGVRRWIAAYWSPARDDVRLHAWCRSVLLWSDSSGG